MKKIALATTLTLLVLPQIAVASPGRGLEGWTAWCYNTPNCLAAHPWVEHKVWRLWCRTKPACEHQYPWVWRSNPGVRYHAWATWCSRHPHCYNRHHKYAPATRLVNLGGSWGRQIMNWPEGSWLSSFQYAANAYGIDVRILLAIGVAESSGGTASGWYMGCMDSQTYGSWPGQINCGAGVLARCGFGCYNSVNPNYVSTVEGIASGIVPEYGR